MTFPDPAFWLLAPFPVCPALEIALLSCCFSTLQSLSPTTSAAVPCSAGFSGHSDVVLAQAGTTLRPG